MKKVLSKLNDKAVMLEAQLENEKDEKKRKVINKAELSPRIL